MRQINLDRPLWIAAHFGFRPIDPPTVNDEDTKLTNSEELVKISGKLAGNSAEKAAFLRIHQGKIILGEPLAFSWRRGPDYSFDLVGYPAGVAEAKLIRTSFSILRDEGHNDLSVEINSMGDKDSIAIYERELKNFLSKKSSEISPELKKILKDDVFSLVNAEGEEVQNLRKDMPSSIAYLSAQSRSNLKEVLEYLEALPVEYRFTPELLGNKNICSETVFVIRNAASELLGVGYRYSRLAKRVGLKRETPLVGISLLGLKRAKDSKIYKEPPRAKFYLIHLGREARLKALPLIELLRSSHIPTYHFLAHEKLGLQMQTPEAIRTPYHLIIGQKEALDNTVTVRNVSSRAQDTVPIELLPTYLKHLPF